MLIIVHHLILVIEKKTFKYWVKTQLLVLIVHMVQQKKIGINFSNAKTKFCFSLQYHDDESYLYENKTEICKFKENDIISWYNFCLGSMSKDFTKDEQNEISLNDPLYDFSVDHN